MTVLNAEDRDRIRAAINDRRRRQLGITSGNLRSQPHTPAQAYRRCEAGPPSPFGRCRSYAQAGSRFCAMHTRTEATR